jgi:hypothetical protein
VKSTMVLTDDEKTLESSYLHFKDDLTIQIHIEKLPPEPGQKLHLDIMFTSFKSKCLLFIELYGIIMLYTINLISLLKFKVLRGVDVASCQQYYR